MWKVHSNKGRGIVVLRHTDESATCTTDYQRADALAKRILGSARLYATGTILDTPMRAYYKAA